MATRSPLLTRRRVVAALGVACAVTAGLFVHFALPDSSATDIAGDALYAAAVSLGLMLLVPRWHPLVIGVVAAAWCVSVELFQLTGLPEQWGAHFTPAMLVLGTVFEPRDVAVYVVTVALVAVVDMAARRVARSMEARRDRR